MERGTPFTADMLRDLESSMPLVAREALTYTLFMLSHGHVAETFLIEKNGAFGATNFDLIADDKTGSTLLLYRLALNMMGVTSAAAAMEVTSHDASGPIDGVTIMCWTPSEERTWHFGVDSLGPEPRKLLVEADVLHTYSWMSELLAPISISDFEPHSRNAIRKEVEQLSRKLRPLIVSPRNPMRFGLKPAGKLQ